jgi:hypothetical protein
MFASLRNFFDYIFYRTAKFYYKWDKESGITAIFALSFMQFMIISIFLLFPVRLIYPISETAKLTKQFGYAGGIIIAIICVLNFKIYYNKYEEIKKKFTDETFSFAKGFLTFIALTAPLIIFLILIVKFKPLAN